MIARDVKDLIWHLAMLVPEAAYDRLSLPTIEAAVQWIDAAEEPRRKKRTPRERRRDAAEENPAERGTA